MEALFWWAEDAEYCEWRIPEAGFPRRVIDAAVVRHDAIRQGGDIPTWKYYYESRNMLYYHFHIMHRVGRFPKKITSLILRALLRQRSDRIGCIRAICRGLYDGAFSRLGIRYEVSVLTERDISPSANPA
jgi:GT2 family glycosyltransferase